MIDAGDPLVILGIGSCYNFAVLYPDECIVFECPKLNIEVLFNFNIEFSTGIGQDGCQINLTKKYKEDNSQYSKRFYRFSYYILTMLKRFYSTIHLSQVLSLYWKISD